MAIWQTERDICYMYRHAIKPAEQIRILAELNGCSEEEIRDVLEHNGIEPVGARRVKHRPKHKQWSVEQLVQLLYLDANGVPDHRLAAYFNRTEYAVKSMKSKINKRSTEPARVALEIFNRQRRSNSNDCA